MSEFKFACPVCGQHIFADSSHSGTQIDCPTCYRAIIVPQAPSLKDTRLIVTAAQPATPRPIRGLPPPPEKPEQSSRWPVIGLIVVFLGALLAAWLLWGQHLISGS